MAGLPAKVQLHEKYAAKGLDVITVNVEGEEGMAAALVALTKQSVFLTNWCLAEAMNDEVTTALKMKMVPALNIYDRRGTLRETIVGEVKHADLEQLIEELLRE